MRLYEKEPLEVFSPRLSHILHGKADKNAYVMRLYEKEPLEVFSPRLSHILHEKAASRFIPEIKPFPKGRMQISAPPLTPTPHFEMKTPWVIFSPRKRTNPPSREDRLFYVPSSARASRCHSGYIINGRPPPTILHFRDISQNKTLAHYLSLYNHQFANLFRQVPSVAGGINITGKQLVAEGG
ncbi:hypothetical protein AVEN_74153-1 [Araneus ventricosus]|uniref:Uncharacterized protein n=1 Tax=Araneus ventricosus TaxID=182803 RepID=A0A4Y2IZY2_ARAVE|nr:hypothetical protein AVEN_74153-1 [Araneus ventricosus]